MKAVIYCRVSTKEQAEQGFSLDQQEDFNKKYALSNDFEVTKVFVERGESAKTTNRTELKKLMQYCMQNRKEIEALIFYKYDRLSRKLEDQVELNKFFEKLGIKLLSASENNEDGAFANFARNLNTCLAQLDNEQKSERTILGNKGAVGKGRYINHIPIGYIKDKQYSIKPDPETAHYVKKAFEMFATGLYTQKDIIHHLRKEGLASINTNKLSNMLRRQLYRGYLVYHQYFDEPIRGIFEPLIDDETFFRVQAILEGKKPQITAFKRNREEFPLRNYIACPSCNTPLTASWSKGRNNKYAYYHCHNRDCDIKFRIAKDKLENAFIEHLEEIKPDKGLVKLFRAIVEDVYHNHKQEQIKLNDKLNKDLVELTERKKRLTSKYIDEKIAESDYKLLNDDLDASILSKKMDITETKIPEKDLSQCLDYCCFTFSNIQQVWINGDLDLRQRFQKLIYPKGLTYDLCEFRTAQKSIIFNTFEAIRNNEVIYGADDGARTHEYRYHKPGP